MWISRVSLLQAQVVDLQQRLDKSEAEKLDLLNRLLERHNVGTVGVPERIPVATAPIIQVLSPFGDVTEEMKDVLTESAIKEETEYLMKTKGMQLDLARQAAERYVIENHQVIE